MSRVDAPPAPEVLESAKHSPAWWRRVRIAALAVYGVVFATTVVFLGFPLDRESLLLWLAGVVLLATAGSGAGTARRLVRDWLPFAAFLVLYDFSRGLATRIGMPLHVTPQIDVDKVIGFGTVPTVWLQTHLLGPRVSWWEVVPGLVYASHFVVVYAVAAWLWVRDRERWLAFALRFLTLSFAGVATYILVPAAPPWWAADHGYIPPVQQGVGRGWDKIGLHGAGHLLHEGKAAFNPVAAVPSLHVAFATLVAVFLWPRARRWLRVVLALYPLAMGFTLVLEGEHYVADLLVGWLYVLAVMLLWRWLEPKVTAWRLRRMALRGVSLGMEPA
jgi:hypothetical protein